MISALERRGPVTYKCVLAAPQHGATKAWAQAAKELGVDFVPVPRKAGGSKDPNDIAVSMEATRLVSTGRAGAVAVAAADSDFLYLAQRLQAWGHRTVALFRANSKAYLASEFERAGTEVVIFGDEASELGEARRPRMKAVLYPDGQGRVEPMGGGAGAGEALVDTSAVAQRLLELDFLADAGSPLVPAIAKFYVAASVGPLAVWPEQLALAQAQREVPELAATAPSTSPGDLAFVFPRASGRASKSVVAKYGSNKAANKLVPGGPFVARVSGLLPEEVLRRLSYLDDVCNSDVSEAIDSFVAASHNRYSLEALGLRIPRHYSVQSKRAALHAALTSPKTHGHWQVAPRDSSVRQFLHAQGLISSVDCHRDEAWEGLKRHAQRREIPSGRNYNTLVSNVLNSLNEHPTKRSS